MKHLYKLIALAIVLVWTVEPLVAQQEVTVRDLNTYDETITDQNDLTGHPLVGEEVTFDAIVVAYPRNSGLATPDDGDSGGEPGRIHLFVTDVNAADMGREGMSMQLVVEGAQQRTLESLDRGDVIEIVGELTFFGVESQFSASDVVRLGNANIDPQYENLLPLLDPIELSISDLNQSVDGRENTWIEEQYSKYIHTYVKFTGAEVNNRQAGQPGNRPWFILTDGNARMMSSDISLRYRNDARAPDVPNLLDWGYGFLVVEDGGVADTVLSLDYNYRRFEEDLDGIFNPPAPGSVVNASGFIVLDTFDPDNVDASTTERSFRIVPWEDGIRWTSDGVIWNEDETEILNRTTQGIPNDLVVQGFAPTLDQLSISPEVVTSSDQATISVDVLKPEADYTVKSVQLSYSAYPYTAESGDTTTVDMTANGDTYTFTFDSFDSFTTVDYTINAVTETPEGVETSASESGSFTIESTTQTAPVTFSPDASESYVNSVTVSLSSPSADATIYYTLDGTDPDESSTEYTQALELTESATIRAVAKSAELEMSPVNERTYTVEIQTTETSSLATIRDGNNDENYTYTGEAVVTFATSNRNQIFLMDDSGGLLIDDNPNVIVSEYSAGDIMTNVRGDLGSFGGISQLLPSADPGAPTSTSEIESPVVTLSEIDIDQHQSMLVRINDVQFQETGTFESGENYDLTDSSLSEGETVVFRTQFSDVNYIGQDIPEGPISIKVLVGAYFGTKQLYARFASDFELATSNEVDELPQEFALEQNYPNPFNPTTVIRYSVADVANVKLQVFDVLGRKVATLVNEVKTPGAYTVNFDAGNLSSGAYFYRIDAGDFSTIKKMMLIK
ncbi:chitobiase/beta-hexosaminidase C-terminal domain-containing protein [Gracilimonas sp.]|uniref:chitobiase/beta-hexosaminidase C-terminal domain-containing protein n=1 Tax=Gracilimonas sp. TaxID=1974203 RepID=UPI0028727FA1|nr:chitobiase/beta-hexosaminidase C-terminal domain-containing protein [Gracilimonas sp.]